MLGRGKKRRGRREEVVEYHWTNEEEAASGEGCERLAKEEGDWGDVSWKGGRRVGRQEGGEEE